MVENFKIRLIHNAEEYLHYVGSEITKELSEKFPLIFVSEHISKPVEIRQYHNGEGSVPVELPNFEYNVISTDELGFNHSENDYYEFSIEGKKYNTNVAVLSVIIPGNEEPNGLISYRKSGDSNWIETTKFGWVDEFPIGTEVELKVVTVYHEIYRTTVTLNQNTTVNSVMVRSKGVINFVFGTLVNQLLIENKASLLFTINDGQPVEIKNQKQIEYKFGNDLKIELDLKGRNGQENFIKTYVKSDNSVIEFKVEDSELFETKYDVEFNVICYDGLGNIVENVDHSDTRILVSIDEASVITVNYGEKLKVNEGANISYQVIKEGYQSRDGELKNIVENSTVTVKIPVNHYLMQYAVKPAGSEVTVNGVKKDLTPGVYDTWFHFVKYNLRCTPPADNFNFKPFESEYVATSSNTIFVELEPKDVTLSVINKETGAQITSGVVVVTKADGTTVEIKPKELATTKFKAGETVNVVVRNTDFPTYIFEQLTLNLNSDVEENIKIEIPFWRKPKATVSVEGEEKNLKIILKRKTDETEFQLTNGAAIELVADKYLLSITAEGRQPIEREIDLNSDYLESFTMIDKLSDPAVMVIKTIPLNMPVEINGQKTVSIKTFVGEKVRVKVTGNFNLLTFDEDVIVESENFEKTIELVKAPYKFSIESDFEDAVFTINNKECREFVTLTPQRITIIGKLEGYHDYVLSLVIEEDTPLNYVVKPEFIDLNQPLSTQQFLDTVENLMRPRRYYNYLTIGRVFRLNGFNINSLYAFYVKFGKYCSSKTDYKIYNLCKTYFEANPME